MNANPRAGEAVAQNGPSGELLAALRRLDLMLFTAVREAEAVYGSESPDTRFRGLAISRQGAERYLSRSPFALNFHNIREAARLGLVDLNEGPVFARLARTFELSQFDLDALLIALAPDLELRYERLFGYIQDDVTRRRPNVELVLDLLCDSPADKLAKRAKLGPTGPLVRHRLVHLVPDPNHLHPPLLGHYLKPDSQVLSLVLDEGAVDERIAGIAEVTESGLSIDDLVLAGTTSRALRAIGERLREQANVLAWFFGPAGTGKTTAAGALAKLAGTKLLSVRLPGACTGVTPFIQVALREALFKNWLVHLSVSSLQDMDEFCRELLDPRAVLPGCVAVSAEQKPPSGLMSHVIPVHFEAIRREDRRRVWTASLKEFGAATGNGTLNTLSRRFRIPPGHIHRAVEEAVRREVACDTASRRSGESYLTEASLARGSLPVCSQPLLGCRPH